MSDHDGLQVTFLGVLGHMDQRCQALEKECDVLRDRLAFVKAEMDLLEQERDTALYENERLRGEA